MRCHINVGSGNVPTVLFTFTIYINWADLNSPPYTINVLFADRYYPEILESSHVCPLFAPDDSLRSWRVFTHREGGLRWVLRSGNGKIYVQLFLTSKDSVLLQCIQRRLISLPMRWRYWWGGGIANSNHVPLTLGLYVVGHGNIEYGSSHSPNAVCNDPVSPGGLRSDPLFSLTFNNGVPIDRLTIIVQNNNSISAYIITTSPGFLSMIIIVWII